MILPLNTCMDHACICDFFEDAQLQNGNCVLKNGETLKKAVRKEYRTLSADERRKLIEGFKSMKTSGEYQTFLRHHESAKIAPEAHAGPAFLLFHREYIKGVELSMRITDHTIAIAYIDWTFEDALENPEDSVLFSEHLMGESPEGGGYIVTGPFKNWETSEGAPGIKRNIARMVNGTKFRPISSRTVDQIVSTNKLEDMFTFSYPQPTCPYARNNLGNGLEYAHGRIQTFIGDFYSVIYHTDNQDVLRKSGMEDPVEDIQEERTRVISEVVKMGFAEKEQKHVTKQTQDEWPDQNSTSQIIAAEEVKTNLKFVDEDVSKLPKVEDRIEVEQKTTTTMPISSPTTTLAPPPVPIPRILPPNVEIDSPGYDETCDMIADVQTRYFCHKLAEWDEKARSEAKTGQVSNPSASTNPDPFQKVCTDLACLCGYLKGDGLLQNNKCILSDGKELQKAVRKEYRILSTEERGRFHNVLRDMHKDGEFRAFTEYQYKAEAHAGSAFLPFNREYLKRFELTLRTYDSTLALPYIDWSLEDALENPGDSVLFSEFLLGETPEGGGFILNGNFKDWMTKEGHLGINRNVGRNINGTQFRPINSKMVNRLKNTFNIDQIISSTQPAESERESRYPENEEKCNAPQHFADAPMSPFEPLKNRDGLSNNYTRNLYEYEPSPTCSEAQPDGCNSETNCMYSCGVCFPDYYEYGLCKDYHPTCQLWASQGQCALNPWMAGGN
ncbi:hypothetical protein WR25_09141 [Diploscapter pachys]|uniref:Tyrosinase copper-binding domain-containing protein n=1 Tax=Diploscapter pachys TaxID=2018661 RepID=A0A2A2LIM0_9BILA|nr:hypothetical protein WR25_09141 [Diploscapter pachys]